MTLKDLIKQFRRERDDAVRPYKWTDDDVFAYLNSAYDEVCERALLVEDKTTADCCVITMVQTQSVYPLHAAVIQVKRVTYGGKVITVSSVEKEDGNDLVWETRNGPPSRYILANDTTIQFTPTPDAASVATHDYINLTVYRRLLVPYTKDSNKDLELLDVPAIYHQRMLPWMYSRALRKNDTQTIDLEGAGEQEAIFERAFGVRPDANVQRKRRDRRPPVVRIRW